MLIPAAGVLLLSDQKDGSSATSGASLLIWAVIVV